MSATHPEPSGLAERERRERVERLRRELRDCVDDFCVIRDPWQRRNLARRRRELREALAILDAARSPQP